MPMRKRGRPRLNTKRMSRGGSVLRGADDLRRLSKGITESHIIEESKLFNTKSQIDSLLDGLTKMEKLRHEDET